MPTANTGRQISGSFAEHEKARLVAKPKRANASGSPSKCEGSKSHAEINPEMVQFAKGLCQHKHDNSLRVIAADLAERGCGNVNGSEYSSLQGRQCWLYLVRQVLAGSTFQGWLPLRFRSEVPRCSPRACMPNFFVQPA
ncbi:MAG: hypothetical protein K5821_15860 [Nitrobacter sp.]|uniref:hypothetical protein n=1 Tax=Nitrobacter sp. TaxID=29420 RepID=UPI00261D33F5|nr:hypothetical protein [Nitrobacter sp.]MCV0387845.1 hypothetical protein [Nitrobacter sp.]